jgi:hypothetical protein
MSTTAAMFSATAEAARATQAAHGFAKGQPLYMTGAGIWAKPDPTAAEKLASAMVVAVIDVNTIVYADDGEISFLAAEVDAITASSADRVAAGQLRMGEWYYYDTTGKLTVTANQIFDHPIAFALSATKLKIDMHRPVATSGVEMRNKLYLARAHTSNTYNTNMYTFTPSDTSAQYQIGTSSALPVAARMQFTAAHTILNIGGAIVVGSNTIAINKTTQFRMSANAKLSTNQSAADAIDMYIQRTRSGVTTVIGYGGNGYVNASASGYGGPYCAAECLHDFVAGDIIDISFVGTAPGWGVQMQTILIEESETSPKMIADPPVINGGVSGGARYDIAMVKMSTNTFEFYEDAYFRFRVSAGTFQVTSVAVNRSMSVYGFNSGSSATAAWPPAAETTAMVSGHTALTAGTFLSAGTEGLSSDWDDHACYWLETNSVPVKYRVTLQGGTNLTAVVERWDFTAMANDRKIVLA